MLQSIHFIVLTDFSEGSNAAAHWAAHQLASAGGTLHLLHALQIPSGGHAVLVNIQPELEKNALEDLERQKTELIQQVPPIKVECHLIHASIPVAVKRLADMLGHALLFMGTQGKSGIDSFLLGSASRTMAEHTTLPLILIPPRAKPGSINRCLLAGCLKDAESIGQMRRLLDALRGDQKQLNVLFVDETGYGPEPEQIKAAHALLSQFGWGEQNVKVHQADDKAKGILAYLSQHAADLLILQKVHHNWLERLFVPSVVRHLSADTPVPLLVLPE